MINNFRHVLDSSIYQTNVNHEESLADQLEDLIDQYRAHMGDQDPTQELAILQKLQNFLTANQSLILELCDRNGYRQDSSNWTEHYSTFLRHSVQLIQEMIDFHKEHPSEPLPKSSLDLLNELTTQLHYLMANLT